MKYYIRTALVTAILLSFCACSQTDNANTDTVFFYYPRDEITYWESDGVIASESRDSYGNVDDLQYLLSLYLQGPVSSDLRSPFPEDLQLVRLNQDEQTIDIVLGSSLDRFSGLEKTLAYTCLAMTCLDLTGAASVRIATEAGLIAGESPIVMDRSSFLLLDNSVSALNPTEPTDVQ